MYDIIVIGDTWFDTFAKLHDANVLCDIDPDTCHMCLPYGEKLELEALEDQIAGSAPNVAIGFSRLGFRTAIATCADDNELGDRAIRRFREEHVDTSLVCRTKKRSINRATVIYFQHERTILFQPLKQSYSVPSAETPWMYLSNLSEGYQAFQNKLAKHVTKNNIKLAFNPGKTQLKGDKKSMENILQATHILFLNKEEGVELLGVKASLSIKTLLKRLYDRGPAIIVLTDGPNGSYAYDGSTMESLGIFHGPLVERTGAGDAFGTGFTAAMIYGGNLHDALKWGTINSGYVVRDIGGQRGLLTKKRLDALLKGKPRFKQLTK